MARREAAVEREEAALARRRAITTNHDFQILRQATARNQEALDSLIQQVAALSTALRFERASPMHAVEVPRRNVPAAATRRTRSPSVEGTAASADVAATPQATRRPHVAHAPSNRYLAPVEEVVPSISNRLPTSMRGEIVEPALNRRLTLLEERANNS